MVERSELEKRVRRLIAADISYRSLKSLGEKGIRRLNKRAQEIVELLEEEESMDRFHAGIRETEEEKSSRTLRQGIDAFTEEHPRYGKILEGLIAETRLQKNRHLIYRLNPGYNLSEEDYVQIIVDLGFERREASAIYPHILAISERLKKADEQKERSILIG